MPPGKYGRTAENDITDKDDNVLKFDFAASKDKPLKILCVGAHSDDIEIGCGGTILRTLSEHHSVEVLWVVFSAGGARKKEAITSAGKFLADAKKKTIIVNNYKMSYFPYSGEKIKNYFETLKKKISPDIIFTHYRQDLHQDHQLISDLTWNTFRDHLILEYEIPKYDGDIGCPNFFVPISSSICRQKIDFIIGCFRSQSLKQWFSRETFQSMLRLRGIESNAPDKYAEAFYCRKIVL